LALDRGELAPLPIKSSY